MAEMADADIDRKLNEWLRANNSRWHEWADVLKLEPETVVNKMVMAAMRLAFRAGMDAAKQENTESIREIIERRSSEQESK